MQIETIIVGTIGEFIQRMDMEVMPIREAESDLKKKDELAREANRKVKETGEEAEAKTAAQIASEEKDAKEKAAAAKKAKKNLNQKAEELKEKMFILDVALIKLLEENGRITQPTYKAPDGSSASVAIEGVVLNGSGHKFNYPRIVSVTPLSAYNLIRYDEINLMSKLDQIPAEVLLFELKK